VTGLLRAQAVSALLQDTSEVAVSVELIESDEHVVLAPEVCETFLEMLAAEPGIGHVAALRELGVAGTRRQIKDAIERQLKADIDAVRNDVIRTALYSRGIDGWDEPVFHAGAEVGVVRRFSDRCLVALAQMKLPEARNQLDVNLAGAGGGPVRVEVEGGRVSTVSGVLALAAALGVKGAPTGLDTGPDRRALPAASPVLPDPPVDQ
jgi:hypothetical protein